MQRLDELFVIEDAKLHSGIWPDLSGRMVYRTMGNLRLAEEAVDLPVDGGRDQGGRELVAHGAQESEQRAEVFGGVGGPGDDSHRVFPCQGFVVDQGAGTHGAGGVGAENEEHAVVLDAQAGGPALGVPLDVALAGRNRALPLVGEGGAVGGFDEFPTGGIGLGNCGQWDGPFGAALDDAEAEVLVEGDTEGHEGGDDKLAIASMAEDFVHDLGADAFIVVSIWAGASARGFGGANPGDALAGDWRAAEPHGQRKAGGGADGIARLLGEEVLADAGPGAGVEIFPEADQVLAGMGVAHPAGLGDPVELFVCDPAEVDGHSS